MSISDKDLEDFLEGMEELNRRNEEEEERLRNEAERQVERDLEDKLDSSKGHDDY